MSDKNSQDVLFQRIKEMLPSDISLADAVSQILHLSLDSSYRRIRGETPLVLEEAKILCHHFKLSLDQLMQEDKGIVLFRDFRVENKKYDYRQYLSDLEERLKQINLLRQKEIIYMSKDLPIFHNFYFQPLSAFRYFFWMKTHLLHPDFEKRIFDFDVLPPDIEQQSTSITRLYSKVPCSEMWNTESINSTISQIEFSKESGHFSSAADIRRVYESLEETLQHIQLQAECGKKFMPGDDPAESGGHLRFFYNRVVLGDNTIMVTADSVRSAIINYGNLNYISTNDEEFCTKLYGDFEHLIRRSTQISQSGEKQRNIFFHILFSKINDRKRNL